MNHRADELFTKNFVKFVSSNGGLSLRAVDPRDGGRVGEFIKTFKREISRKYLVLHDEARIPDMGVIVAHSVGRKGLGLAVSTTGFMFVDRFLRADFIPWVDSIDLMDHFSKERRPKLRGWIGAFASFLLLYFGWHLLASGIDAQIAMEARKHLGLRGSPISLGEIGALYVAGLAILILATPPSLWAVRHVLGPKALYFGDPSRMWSGRWFINRDRIFACLRRGTLIWEKAHSQST